MRKSTIHLFLIIEFFIYILFLTLDLTGRNAASIPWKYAGILLCCFFSAFSCTHGGNKLTAAAMGLTVLADLFLLVLDQFYIIGILLFCAVQTIYAMRLKTDGANSLLLLRGILSLAAILSLYAADIVSLVNILAGMYFVQLLVNMILAWMNHENSGWAFAPGLTLFVCCDICVGACNMAGLVHSAVFGFCRVGMWLFYLPSQVLIVLSGLPKLSWMKFPSSSYHQ